MARANQLVTQNDVGPFYAGYLKDAVTIFEDAISHLKNAAMSDFDVSEAIDMSHRIKGNAAMYGFPDLGLIAAETEKSLRAETAEDDHAIALLSLITLIEKIQKVCLDGGKAESSELRDILAVEDIQAPEVSQSTSPDFDRKTILFAYQDEWMGQLFASLIEPEFKVVTASGGREVLKSVKLHKPDLVVLEEDLGDMKGLDVFKALQASEFYGTPAIYLAFDNGAHERIAEAIGLGIDGFTEDKHNVLEITDFARKTLHNPAKSILVVDDDPMVRELLSYSLSSAGFTVDLACDGVEALDYLSKEIPDLILLDRFMPRLEGGSVLYEIQNKINLKSIPVLILTAMDNQGEARNWFERGAADFIPKPFDPAEVLMRVKQHLYASQRKL